MIPRWFQLSRSKVSGFCDCRKCERACLPDLEREHCYKRFSVWRELGIGPVLQDSEAGCRSIARCAAGGLINVAAITALQSGRRPVRTNRRTNEFRNSKQGEVTVVLLKAADRGIARS